MAADEGRYALGDIIEQRDHVAQCSQHFIPRVERSGVKFMSWTHIAKALSTSMNRRVQRKYGGRE